MLEQFIQAIQYKITDGEKYGWNCFGIDSYFLNSDSVDDLYSAQCVFDTKTQEVYQITMWDNAREHHYIWNNPLYKQLYFEESTSRNCNPLEAIDNIQYTELEVLEDIIEKITALYKGEEYDTRISIPIDIDDELYDQLVELAKEQNITVEDLIAEALTSAYNALENK